MRTLRPLVITLALAGAAVLPPTVLAQARASQQPASLVRVFEAPN